MARTKTDKRRKMLEVPQKFTVRFLEEIDRRTTVGKTLFTRIDKLVHDTHSDGCMQRELLCREALWLALCLDSLKVETAEQGVTEFGSYVQGVNALTGLLAKLGTDRLGTDEGEFNKDTFASVLAEEGDK